MQNEKLKPCSDWQQAFKQSLENLTASVEGLISDSGGVYGLHLNGDLAPWEELTEGGRFENWLIALADARVTLTEHAEAGFPTQAATLAACQPEPTPPNTAALVEALECAIRASKLAMFVIRKQGVMPNSSWESGFEGDIAKAEAALATHRASAPAEDAS